MQVALREIQGYYAEAGKAVNNIQKICLSFHVLLDKLSSTSEQRKKRYFLSILKGPIFNGTRRKLQLLENNLNGFSFYSTAIIGSIAEVTAVDKREHATLYQNSKRVADNWRTNQDRAIALKMNLIRKLSVPKGEFWNEINKGNIIGVKEKAAALKKDVEGLLAIIQPFIE